MNENSNIDAEKIVRHWVETSDEDFQTMLGLFESKSYSWSLFIGHISVEKLLKAVYVSRYKKHAPFSHNLYRLAEMGNIEMDDNKSDLLDKVTTFNINARYDDYKREFYLSCTKEFAEEWIENIKTLRIWIKEML